MISSRLIIANLIAALAFLVLPAILIFSGILKVYPESDGTDDTIPLFIITFPFLWALVFSVYLGFKAHLSSQFDNRQKNSKHTFFISMLFLALALIFYAVSIVFGLSVLSYVTYSCILIAIIHLCILVGNFSWWLVMSKHLTMHSSGTTKTVP